MTTLQITYTIDDLSNVIVYNLVSVSHWGISVLPRQGRRPLQYKIDVALLPQRIRDSEGGLVDHVITAEYLFPTFDEATKAITLSSISSFELDLSGVLAKAVIVPEAIKQPSMLNDNPKVLQEAVDPPVAPKELLKAAPTPIVSIASLIDAIIAPKVASKPMLVTSPTEVPNPNKWLSTPSLVIPDVVQRSIIPNKDLEPKHEAPTKVVSKAVDILTQNYTALVTTLPFSEWSLSCMEQKNFNTLEDLIAKTQAELTITMGRKASQDIVGCLSNMGIYLKP